MMHMSSVQYQITKHWADLARAFAEWQKGANVFIGADGRFHAGEGGAIGMNGAHYERGQWVATASETVKGALGSDHRNVIAFAEWVKDPEHKRLCDELSAYAGENDFLLSIRSQLTTKGFLTEPQVEYGFKALARAENKPAQEQDDKAQEYLESHSEHVGSIGERIEVKATIDVVAFIERGYDDGYYLNKLWTSEGDQLIYFGNMLGHRGDMIVLRGTVKRHSERDGVKGTIINRPKVIIEEVV